MNKRSPVKWYQGVGNIVTIISFITLLWPISVIVMWLLSTWDKKIKKLITIIVYLPVFSYVLGNFATSPGKIDAYEFQEFGRSVLVSFPILFLVSLIVAILLYAFRPKLIIKNWKLYYRLLLFFLGIWFFSLGFLSNLKYW